MDSTGSDQVLGQVYVVSSANDDLGFGSVNSASTVLTNHISANINEDDQIANNVAISADTGNNEAIGNTGSAQSSTAVVTIRKRRGRES
jgi:type II secretory pathway component HofQ